MSQTCSDARYIESLLRAVKEDNVDSYVNEMTQDELRQIHRVCKVNVYGPLGPFNAHSTWIIANANEEDETAGPPEDDLGFVAVIYCERVQAFSSTHKYMSVFCNGKHKGDQNFRIGVHVARWTKGSNGENKWGTFGDRNLDEVMEIPTRPRKINLGHTTLSCLYQANNDSTLDTEDNLF